jgi:hypothetical protein
VVVPKLVVLMVAGFHVPVMPLLEVAGSAGAIALRQSGPIWVNVGVSWAVMVISIVVVEAHCPAFGVKVYVVVPVLAVLIVAGFQVPVIPLLEVAANVGAIAFWHNGPICVNVGMIELLIVMSIVTTDAHCPVFGVKV